VVNTTAGSSMFLLVVIPPAASLVSAGSSMFLLVVILPAASLVSAGSSMFLLVVIPPAASLVSAVILPAGRMVSAGCSMVLLEVIVPAGFFVPAGRYGLWCCHLVSAGSIQSAASQHELGISPFADSDTSSSPSPVSTDHIPIDVLFDSTSGGLHEFFLASIPADYVSAGHVLVPADSDRIC
ncbi:hypothetical protein Tco_0170955, partial [Tanacetum coccineum]